MNSTKKIEKNRIEDFISDSTKVELDKRIQSINGITPDANGAATLALTQVVDNLTSVESTKALSANQGKVLKGLIDTINGVLQSDDGTLDELQEIVNYIKQNKTDLQNLSIGNIAGLTQALADAETNANNYTNTELAKIAALTKTGTALELDNIEGNNYNYATPSSAETYTTTNPVINGFARCFINAANEPTVTGSTKIKGAAFQANVLMEMVVESTDGTNVQHFFLEI
jgi:hypothetical protein